MDRFIEPPPTNSPRKLNTIFTEAANSTCRGRDWQGFVPYAQERDHLGRLLSRQRREPRSRNTSWRSLKTLPRSSVDPAIDRAFRLTRVATQEKPSDRKKHRIRSSSCKESIPAVGSYDADSIADRVKYRKAREVVFSANKPQVKKMPTETAKKQQKAVRYHEVATEPGIEIKKMSLNLNLPELEKYLQMRKLTVPLHQNFEESHLKFKELARKGLLLGSSLRNSMQFG